MRFGFRVNPISTTTLPLPKNEIRFKNGQKWLKNFYRDLVVRIFVLTIVLIKIINCLDDLLLSFYYTKEIFESKLLQKQKSIYMRKIKRSWLIFSNLISKRNNVVRQQTWEQNHIFWPLPGISFEFFHETHYIPQPIPIPHPRPSICKWIHFRRHHDNMTTTPEQNHIYVLDLIQATSLINTALKWIIWSSIEKNVIRQTSHFSGVNFNQSSSKDSIFGAIGAVTNFSFSPKWRKLSNVNRPQPLAHFV